MSVLLTPHVHIWMVYIVKVQFQMPIHMPMYKYIDSNNKYIQQNWIHSHQIVYQMNVYIHILILQNLGYGQLTVKSGIWDIWG